MAKRKLPRVLELLEMVARAPGRACDVESVARHFHVHTRTIKRDVASLSDAASAGLVPKIYLERRLKRKPWVVLGRETEKAAELFRYAAVSCAVRHLQALGDTVLGPCAEDHLKDMQPTSEVASRVESAFHYVPFGPKQYADKGDVLDDLVRAVLYRHPIRFDYTRNGEVKTHKGAKPYTLVMYRDGFYVLADIGKDTPTLFSVDRISNLEFGKKHFTLPKDWAPERHFEGIIGVWKSEQPAQQVVLAFDESVADAARERHWPGFVSWAQGTDGRPQLTLSIAPTPELESWLLSWGSKVEVLEPAGLREALSQRAAELAGLYSVAPQVVAVPEGPRKRAPRAKEPTPGTPKRGPGRPRKA